MQSADIRLAPSETLSIEFDGTNLNYKQQEKDATSNILGNGYDGDTNEMENLHLGTFSNLSLSTATQPHQYHNVDLLPGMNGSHDNDRQVDHYVEQVESSDVEDLDDEVEEEEEAEEQQLPSATADAMETYKNITENIYCGSATGKTIAEESMPCECKYRPDLDNPDAACGDDNYCINRMMFMECMVDDCPCDRYCRNRRFQLKQYARVDVIRTEKKGFGLRALTDLPTNAFIMEYIGEVIPNREFIRRTKEYEAAGLEHYYFMTLKTDEIIDATKKGCLARFINHSCNPNSVTQKWVVGKTMRIGIFTRRPIKAGQELTFDYKFERYGAVAQKCYCGESSCKGYIGGSSKNETKTKVPLAPNAEDLQSNEDDEDEEDEDEDDQSEDDDSDTAEAVTLTQKKMLRKMHRHRASEPLQDPNEVQSFVKRMLDSVGKSHLVLKLLACLELTDKDTPEGRDILKKFVRLHGLKMLKFWLSEWKNDPNILIKVLQVLPQLPLANKNGLEDCKMLEIVDKLADHENKEICELSKQLLEDWSKLKSVYRIPKRAPTDSSHKVNTNVHKDNNDEDTTEILENITHPPKYDSTREFFDPDDDLFEYLSLNVDAAEIQWKTEYPPKSSIPTAPRAMIDACIKNGYYGFGRPARTSTPNYQSYPTNSDSMTNIDNVTTDSLDMQDRTNSSYSSPYRPSKLTESYSASGLNTASYFDSPLHNSPGNTALTNPMNIETTSPTSVPPKLPSNWKFAYAEDGTIYYYHRITGKTQWNSPEEKVSSIEGVNQSDLEDLVEKTIQDAEKKKLEYARSASPAMSIASRTGLKSSPQIITPSTSRRGSRDAVNNCLDEPELKKEVGKIVTKYLSSKQKNLWSGDKHLFKELARKITHHIVEREIHSARKIQSMNSNIKTKIEKFIDSHGSDLVVKINRKRKYQSISSSTSSKEKTTSPSSVISEETNKAPKLSVLQSIEDQAMQEINELHENTINEWEYPEDNDGSSVSKRILPMVNDDNEKVADSITLMSVTKSPSPTLDSDRSMHDTEKDEDYHYNRRNRAGSPPPSSYRSSSREKVYNQSSGRDYVRPGYNRPSHYNLYNPSSSYHRYSQPTPYQRNSGPRYYSNGSRRPSPPHYHHRHSASSSRRGSLSDDEIDRRRWD